MFAPYRAAGWSPKFIASIGGWTYSRASSNIPGSGNFFAAFGSMTDADMLTWATATVWFAQYWGFDGIDVDYELDNPAVNYGPTSILPRLATAFNTAIQNKAVFSTFSENLSVTVQGSYVEVGGALPTSGTYGFVNNNTLRVVNLMLYDSGNLTQYEPRAFGEQFITAQDAPGLSGIPPNKLGFGIEIVPQATGPGIAPYQMDMATAQTLAYYAGNRPDGGYKEIFFWMFSLPALAPSTFATYMHFVCAGAYPLVYTGYDAALSEMLPFYWFTTNALYFLGPQNVQTAQSWIPGKPQPSAKNALLLTNS
jgi:hypothetical protein